MFECCVYVLCSRLLAHWTARHTFAYVIFYFILFPSFLALRLHFRIARTTHERMAKRNCAQRTTMTTTMTYALCARLTFYWVRASNAIWKQPAAQKISKLKNINGAAPGRWFCECSTRQLPNSERNGKWLRWACVCASVCMQYARRLANNANETSYRERLRPKTKEKRPQHSSNVRVDTCIVCCIQSAQTQVAFIRRQLVRCFKNETNWSSVHRFLYKHKHMLTYFVQTSMKATN